MRLLWLFLLLALPAGALPARPSNLVWVQPGAVTDSGDLAAAVARSQADATRRGVDLAVLVVRDFSGNPSGLGLSVQRDWKLRSRSVVLLVSPQLREGHIVLDEAWKSGWQDWGDYIVAERVRPALEKGKLAEALAGAADSIDELSKVDKDASPPDLAPGYRVEKLARRWGRYSCFSAGWFTGLLVLSISLLVVSLTYPGLRRGTLSSGLVVLAFDLYAPAGLVALLVVLAWAAVSRQKRKTPAERPPLYL